MSDPKPNPESTLMQEVLDAEEAEILAWLAQDEPVVPDEHFDWERLLESEDA